MGGVSCGGREYFTGLEFDGKLGFYSEIGIMRVGESRGFLFFLSFW